MNSKEKKIKEFDPNNVSSSNNLFGLPFTEDESEVIIIPVPWEVTVSYSAGTANGPEAVLHASGQVDLYDPFCKDAWKKGIFMLPFSYAIKSKSEVLREKAADYIQALTSGTISETDASAQIIIAEVDDGAKELNNWVKNECLNNIKKGKLVALLGGDHSTPLGFMQALAELNEEYGILQIDAHADLRESFEGFEFSHASIMYNALKLKQVKKLVQVGIRDFCQSEFEIINKSKGRIKTFFDRDIKHSLYKGETWDKICNDIIEALPDKVYISFDIDGLDPKLCPNTGTPVAGGFEAEEVLYLFEKLVISGKKIIGFDLNEIAPGESEWDANVGARLLYRLANLMAKSYNKTS
jgi:agmatinase